jgi:hypothetical protein
MPDTPQPQNTAKRTAEAVTEATQDTANRLASRGLEFGTQTMEAYVEAGKRASAALGDVNKAVTESYSRSLSDYDALSKQALTVKTVQDFVDLQTAMVQKLQDNFSTMTHIYSLYINAVATSVQPIAEQVRQVPEKLQRAA